MEIQTESFWNSVWFYQYLSASLTSDAFLTTSIWPLWTKIACKSDGKIFMSIHATILKQVQNFNSILKFITISKRALKMNSLKYCLYRFRNKNSSQDIKSFFLYAFQYQIFRISLISLKYCLYRSTVCSLSYRYQMLFFMIILRNATVFLVLFNQSTIGYHQIDFKHCLWI